MATSLNLDPFDMWRQALTKLEGGVNALSNRSMNSDEFTQALHQFSTVALGMQHVFEKALGAYFKTINLPSRKDVTELATALQRIEDKLDQLVPAPQPSGPRPARTRRPPSEAAAPAAASAPEASTEPPAVGAKRRARPSASRATTRARTKGRST